MDELAAFSAYPIVQAPMAGGASNPRLAAAVSARADTIEVSARLDGKIFLS